MAYWLLQSNPGGRFSMADVKALRPVETPVTLGAIKAGPGLEILALLGFSRLSVAPIRGPEWEILCAMAGTGACGFKEWGSSARSR